MLGSLDRTKPSAKPGLSVEGTAPAEAVELFPADSLADPGEEPEAVNPRATQVQRVPSKASQHLHLEIRSSPVVGSPE